MECEQIDAVFDRALDSRELPDEARRHLAACPRCQALYDWLSAPTIADITPRLHDQIAASLPATRVKRLPSVRRMAFEVIAGSAGLLVVLLTLKGTAGVSQMTALQLVSMSALVAGGMALVSLSLVWQTRPGSRQIPRPVATLASLGAACMAAMAGLFSWRPSRAFAGEGWPCLAGGLAVALVAAFLVGVLVRRGAPLAVRTMGATMGAAAGWLGLAFLQFQCPRQEAHHLLVWHGSVLAVAAAAGGAVAHLVRNFRRPSREVI